MNPGVPLGPDLDPGRELEEVCSCFVCGTEKVATTFERGVGLRVHECASCGLAYVSPRPTWDAMLRHYEHDYATQGLERQWRDSISFDLQRDDVERVERLMSLPGAAVLDVGCGPGLFLEAVRRRGAARLAGIEPGVEAAEFAARMLPGAVAVRTTFEEADADLGDERFTLVGGFDLIEHLYDPRRFLRWSRNRLADGGLLYLKTPNWDAVRRYGAAWEGLWRDFEHVYYFTRSTLGRLLAEEGFTVVATGYEPYRAGLGGTERLAAATASRPLVEVARSAIRRLPVLNRGTYRVLQRLRAWKSRDDVRSGTAHGLIVAARRR